MVQKDTITVLVIIATLCASICYCHPAPAGYNDDDDIETAIQGREALIMKLNTSYL